MDNTFSSNKLYTDTEYYDAVINHLNQIEDIPNKKKFEWEDLPATETHNITNDRDEWLDKFEKSLNEFYLDRLEDGPENIRKNLIHYNELLEDYFDGYLLDNVGMYQGTGFFTCSHNSESLDNMFSFIENIRKDCDKIFLYEFYKFKKLFEDNPTPQEEVYYYRLRYGAVKPNTNLGIE
jgi:hypothetical protein